MTKADYTTEEWTLLLQSLSNAATHVVIADLTAMGALREMRALGKALKRPSVQAAAQELADSLITDIEEMSKEKEFVASPEIQEGEDAREKVRQGLQQAAVLLDAKCSPEEAAGFKEWLLDIATAVAQADKEGSHFGIGGVRVTETEMAALAELKSTLGFVWPRHPLKN